MNKHQNFNRSSQLVGRQTNHALTKMWISLHLNFQISRPEAADHQVDASQGGSHWLNAFCAPILVSKKSFTRAAGQRLPVITRNVSEGSAKLSLAHASGWDSASRRSLNGIPPTNVTRVSIFSRAEPDASAFRLISRRALAHGFRPMIRSTP